MIIGVDIGTTVTKAAGFSHDGRPLVSASRRSIVHRLSGGRVEQNLDDVIATVTDVVGEVATKSTEPVEALAITGQGDGLWLRDHHGNATHRPISWMDARASAIVADWRRGGPDSVVQQVYAQTGSGIFPGCHASLLAHLNEYDPSVLEKSAVAGYCVDAVLHRLTGDITVEASDASLPFLDVTRRQYVDEAINTCGIGQWRHLLADPEPPHSLHTLTDDAATALGLSTDTAVSAGPYDLQACGIGSGTQLPGQGTIVLGTTLSCQVITTDRTIDPTSEPAGMWLCTPDPDRYLRVMPSMVGTASIDWVLNLIGAGHEDVAALMRMSPPGARGVRAQSFFSESGERAPFVDPDIRGQFSGMTLSTEPADLVRALYESIAFAARNCFDTLGLPDDLAACGGGIRPREVAQTMANVLGRPIRIAPEDLVGARGAAANAWRSLGAPVSMHDWLSDHFTVDPDPQTQSHYDEAYEKYLSDLSGTRNRA